MGTISSSKLQVKRGDAPDESRPFAAHGHAEMHKLGNGTVMRAVFEPGWKWSRDIAPIAGTRSCEASHLGYIVSGRLKIRMDDGAEAEVGPGDFIEVSPGHDAWVVGSEACVVVDFAGYEQYAQRTAAPQRGSEGQAEQVDSRR
jgi:hypothetical protein